MRVSAFQDTATVYEVRYKHTFVIHMPACFLWFFYSPYMSLYGMKAIDLLYFRYGNAAVVTFLVDEAKCNVNVQDSHGDSLLHSASK